MLIARTLRSASSCAGEPVETSTPPGTTRPTSAAIAASSVRIRFRTTSTVAAAGPDEIIDHTTVAGNLSRPQFQILARLNAAPGGRLRMTDLADGLVYSRSGLTYQASLLEKGGLVTRSPGEDMSAASR
jgi:hypothetical protein